MLDTFNVNHEHGRVVQAQDFYPFGMAHQPMALQNPTNPYLFQGAELTNNFGLGWYDFGLRGNYLPDLGRWGSSDPAADAYYGYSNYHFGGNNPLRNYEVDGAKYYSPIYDWNGNFMGTDNLGLQGEAIVMHSADFMQGMTHAEAVQMGTMYSDLPMMMNPTILDAISMHHAGLPSRPDWDGIVTDLEARAWWQANSGDPLFVDVSQLNLSPLTTSSFDGDEMLRYNFFTSIRTSRRTGRVHGTLSMRLKNAKTGEVGFFRDDNGFFDTYDFNGDGRILRDITTWGARQIVGEGTGFGFIPYGSNPQVPVR